MSKKKKSLLVYRFLTGPDDATFCHKVTKALSEGWEIFGSPALSYDPVEKRTMCGQAVVKEVKGEEYDPMKKLSDY